MGHATTILYVDDLSGLREDFRSYFENAGYRVLLAASAEEALGFLDGGTVIGAIVSDLTMGGGMSGFDLLARVRQSQPDLPFVVVSGHTSLKARERAGLLRSSAFFEKPYRFAELHEKLEKLLARA